MTVPLTLLAACLHWRWVLLALLAAGVYYYIMYKLRSKAPLAKQAVTAFGKAGKALLWLTALWLVCLAGYLSTRSTLSFPQTAAKPLTGLLLLALASWAAKIGIRAVVRCSVILLLLLTVLYGIVLLFSAPQVRLPNLAPFGDPTQALLFFPVLTVPTLLLYYRPIRDGTRPAPWLIAGAVLALAASVITAGCLSPQLAQEETGFYDLSRSVSLFGTVQRFESLISSASLVGFFCAISFLLCTAREILSSLLPQLSGKSLFLFPFAAAGALLSSGISPVVFAVGAATFCAVFPLVTQGIGGIKKV